LKLKYDEALSNSAFNFNLRRYVVAVITNGTAVLGLGGMVQVKTS